MSVRPPLLAMRACVAGLALVTACSDSAAKQRDWAAQLTHGDPDRGRALMRPYGCASCHDIPGIPGARAKVGPPLGGIASRAYIAGVVTNDPENMVKWIVDPKSIDAKTAMPKTGVTEEQARHIAAYLYTLR